jgi:hypothetical protein
VKQAVVSALLAVIGLAASASALPNEAYVWQRQWTPELAASIHQSAAMFTGWRVLFAETDTPRHLRQFTVDWQALAATHKAVTAVIRIDGHTTLKDANFASQIGALDHAWAAQHVDVAGVEIDYDCGVARLIEYSDFLRALRKALPSGERVSITGLPAWLDHPDFAGVAESADEIVLQVHAVRAPQLGLFDAPTAKRWIADLAAKDSRPFRVALPDYSTRVVRGDKGQIVAVESEEPRLVAGSSAEELLAVPSDVAAFVRDLSKDHPRQLEGLVWFRLPTAADQRTWSLSTLDAVIHAGVPPPRTSVELRPGLVPGAYDIVLHNDGETDMPLPARIEVTPDCTFADAVNGFTLSREGGRISLRRLQIGMLRAHHEQIVGWTRCQGIVHVAN